jgi:hypothetical protein
LIVEWQLKNIGLDNVQTRMGIRREAVNGQRSRADGDGVTIDGGDVDIAPMPTGPAEDGARNVCRSGGQIDDADALSRLPRTAESLQVRNDRARIAEKGINATDEAKGALKLMWVDAGLVHPLRRALSAIVKPIEWHSQEKRECSILLLIELGPVPL